MPYWEVTVIFGAAVAGVTLATLWIVFMSQRDPGNSNTLDDSVSFLFDNDMLHHASETAMRLHQVTPGQDSWQSLRHLLKSRFPGFPDEPLAHSGGALTINSRHSEDPARIHLSKNGDFTQVIVREGEVSRSPVEQKELASLTSELENLRRASDTTPHPIWQVNAQKRVIWHNAAYATLYTKLHRSGPEADKPVFPELGTEFGDAKLKRVSTQTNGKQKKDWYDISLIRSGDIQIFHAVNVNAVIDSEIAQRNFVQTLAKTFAQLSIGLAIFDRRGQLALFNPALIDLTNLPADFLSARPTLISFFDRLRENRRMPEPKNYRSWRQEIAEVIAAATDGRYQETWTLETGQTYRVRGRPHPDGAIAFLIEDISAEISLTRNFRAELELGQALMDTFDDALVVFSSTGLLTFSNAAYRRLWGLDLDNTFADVTIADSVREWKRLCTPGARWAALTDFVLDFGDRTAWDMPATLTNGLQLSCHISPITSGATLVRFSRQMPEKPRPGKATRQSSAN